MDLWGKESLKYSVEHARAKLAMLGGAATREEEERQVKDDGFENPDNLAPPPGWAVKKRRRLSWRTRRAQCRAIDITHVDRMPVIQLISLYPHYACLVLLPGE